MLKPGIRVVRGPSWCWGNQDGGEGFAGTVAQIGTSESSKTVVIQWDNGSRTVCRVGYLEKYDLRVIDNAQIGVLHNRITCDACETPRIAGLRYKCLNCYDYDLCFKCYHGMRHDITHTFKRFDTEKSKGVNLPSRFNSTRFRLMGIFVGATVIRGFDWEWGNQDGGEGKYGRVVDIRDWTERSKRSVASVKWNKGNTEIYRRGHKGLSDIQFIEAASGGFYYPDHLPNLGQTEEEMELEQIVEKIELQQVMELTNNENSPKMEQPNEAKKEHNKTTELPLQESMENDCDDPENPLYYAGPPKTVYADVIGFYVRDHLHPGYKEPYDLIKKFFLASRNSSDEAVREMWEVVKYLTDAPSRPSCTCCNIIEKRDESLFIFESVELAKAFLENKYRNYMKSVVNKVNGSGEYGLEYSNIYDLVHDFVNLQFQQEYVGLSDEMHDGLPLWPMVYYCIRAGGFLAAASYLESQNNLEYEPIISLLEFYVHKPKTPQIDILEKEIKRLYETTVRDSSDPFQRIVWAVLGCVDDISEAARSEDDLLWFKLKLIRADSDKDKYKKLQGQILREQEETSKDVFKQPLVYFKRLALTGQYEAAIDFLYRTDRFKMEAVHMAISLFNINLLALPKDTNSPLLSINPEDWEPARRLNIALLINNYVTKFDLDDLDDSLNYLYVLKRIENHEKVDLFVIGVRDLLLRTKEYVQVLGKIEKNGCREQTGLLEIMKLNSKYYTDYIAQYLAYKEQYEEAIELYDAVNEQNGLLGVLCKVLTKVVNCENSPGSLRNKFQQIADVFQERFLKPDFTNAKMNMIDSFLKLKGLLTFFDLYHERRYWDALQTLSELKLVPLTLAEIEESVKNFQDLKENVSEVMPCVLLATMTIISAHNGEMKRIEGVTIKGFREVWEKANCITNFAERLPDVVPQETLEKLIQMEVSMHS